MIDSLINNEMVHMDILFLLFVLYVAIRRIGKYKADIFRFFAMSPYITRVPLGFSIWHEPVFTSSLSSYYLRYRLL